MFSKDSKIGTPPSITKEKTLDMTHTSEEIKEALKKDKKKGAKK